MITNFEELTCPLSDKEIEAAKTLAKYFNTFCDGKDNAITSNEIYNWGSVDGIVISGPRLRKIINYIRREQLVKNLIASQKGYYRSNDRKEIFRYKQSLQERAAAILEVADSFI